MVANHILSRRSLLKASSFLVVAAAVAPTAALAVPEVPEVLAMLLAEYRDAGAEAKAAHSRLNDAHRARGQLLESARLYAPFSDGRMLRLGEYGNSHHPAYVATLLQKERAQLLAAAGDDAKVRAAINKQFRGLRRSLARKHAEYEAVVAKSGYPDASDAENAAYHRFSAADAALGAYRPRTIAEVAAIAAVARDVGPYVGHAHGLSMSDLAIMLNPDLAVA